MSIHRSERLSVHGWLIQVAAWFVIAAVVLVLAAAVLVPRLAGATPYTVLTDSMRPAMPAGTLVVAKPVDADDIEVGDVITYQLKSGEPAVVTHRVVAQGYDLKGTRIFRTQGDANDTVDESSVLPVQVKGARWYYVPYLGHVSNLLTGGQRQVATTVIVIGLFGYAAAMFVGAGRDRRRSLVRSGATP